MIKIGDKVRFLSEVGGGVVSGFQGKDMVLVQDEDGFDIPMPIREVVAVDTNDYNIAKVKTLKKKSEAEDDQFQPTSIKQALAHNLDAEEDDVDTLSRPVTFKAKPVERRDGEKLNISLAFVPKNVKELTTTQFETYIINDCNYFVSYVYMSAEGASWRVRSSGVLEPNTKLFIEEFEKSGLNEIERVCVQFFAYKEDRSFLLKPAGAVQLRVDGVKFYKLHTFQSSPFFTVPALTYDVVRDDEPAHEVFVSATAIKDALLKQHSDAASVSTPKSRPVKNGIIEVDLHIDSLLDTTAGLTPADMLARQIEEFNNVMQENLSRKGQKIVYIHGKGEGVLRKAVEKELRRKYKSCTFQDASFREYGYGATMVTIR